MSRPLNTIPPPTLAPTLIPGALPWDDMNYTVAGVCFEAANDAAGQVFIVRSPADHIRFYDLVDNSQLCRRLIRREPVNFDDDYLLVGLWSAGRGCRARHDLIDFERDDDTQTIDIRVEFVTEGTCDYELVRPLWMGFTGAAEYEISVDVIPSTP